VHEGALAADILDWMRRWRPDLLGRLEYCLIEPSPAHRAWQEQKLRDWLPKIKWVDDIAAAGPAQASRIIFCNEFLDAMPVHRLAWNLAGKNWEECRVACQNGKFTWRQAAPPPELAGQLPEISPELAKVLPAGYVIEHSPAAAAWWKKAATTLTHGKLLTIDYGLTAEEQFSPRTKRRNFARLHPASHQRRRALPSRRNRHHRPRQFLRNRGRGPVRRSHDRRSDEPGPISDTNPGANRIEAGRLRSLDTVAHQTIPNP